MSYITYNQLLILKRNKKVKPGEVYHTSDGIYIILNNNTIQAYSDSALVDDLLNKQNTLIDSLNIKTINGSSILGIGNLSIIGSGADTISFTANVDIIAYLVVTSNGQIGNSNTTSQRNKIIGINISSVLTGFIGEAKGFGEITNSLWSWTIGDKIFLNGTNLSTIAPSTGYIQFIGTAIASDTIDIKLGTSILL